jgi:hypothetical protein
MLRLWDSADDLDTAAGVYYELLGLVVHQGTTYETSAVVARLLIALVAEEHTPHKDLACCLLAATDAVRAGVPKAYFLPRQLSFP